MEENQTQAKTESENPYISRFALFFETQYKKPIEQLIEKYPQKKTLQIDFSELEHFDVELADDFLDRPDYLLEAAKLAIKEIDLPNLISDEFSPHLRFYNLPSGKDTQPQLRDISSTHIGKLITIEGVVAQITDVLPKLKAATWECRRCGNTYKVIQGGSFQEQPTMCECHHRDFSLKAEDSTFSDYQKIRIQEPIEYIKGNHQPTNIDIYVSDDLVNNVAPGDRTKFTGIIRLMPPKEKKLIYGRFLEAIHIEETQQEFTDVQISKEEEAEIKTLAADPAVYEKLVKSIAPNIYGHETIKEAIMLQLFGGVKKVFPGNNKVRGNIHVILIGEPGLAKCVHKDTKLVLQDGTYKKISELVEASLQKNSPVKLDDGCYSNTMFNLPILNEDCNLANAIAIRAYKRKPEKMFYIKTATGKELMVTHTHPFFISVEGKVKATKTMQLKKGDFIATPRKLQIKGQEQDLATDIEPGKTNAVHINFPSVLSKEVARFFAYMLAEGHMQKSKRSESARFINSDKEVVEDFKILSKKIFGLKHGFRFRNNAHEIILSNRELCRFMKKNFPELFEKSRNRKISDHIMRSTDSTAKEFLKAFIETEGCIRKDGRIIEVTSASRELMENLTILLARFGIIGSMKKIRNAATNTKEKIKRDYFKLCIMGRFADKYFREIGFISERKIKKAQVHIFSLKKFNTNTDIVPNVSKELFFLRKKLSLTQFEMGVNRGAYQHYERGDRNPSREQLFLMANSLIEKYLEKNIFDKQAEEKIMNLFKLSKTDIFWDKIKEIKETEPDKWVYDLEVEGTHNFISNMIFSHNSQLLQAVDKIAPKSIYTAGKTTSAAGISATAVKDEFGEGGWTIKAGALVLASGGMALIDELDKMDPNDRSALHESMEQESYHKEFEIDFLGKPKTKIGEFVEKLLEENKDKIIQGKNTLFLDLKEKGHKILSTDFNKIYEKEIAQVSKHKADKDFFEISFQNGRSIKVTENHPCFIIRNGKIEIEFANQLNENDLVPAISPNESNFQYNSQSTATNVFQTTKIKSIKRIDKENEKWVYDIGIEPEHCFISNNLILHNSISVAKAGIVTRFKSETSILAAANPKYSRFDPYRNFMEQINLPASLMSRFDLFFLLRDVLDRKKDEEIAAHILRSHRAGEMLLQKGKMKAKELQELQKSIAPEIDQDHLKKFISFARQTVFPVLSEEAMEAISQFYINLRDQGRKEGAYAATHRQLEGLVRLSEASAKIRLSDKVEPQDTERAIRIFKKSLEELVVDHETGRIDIDIITTGRTTTELTNLKKILSLIREKGAELDLVPIQEIVDEAKTQGIDEEKTREIIGKLEKIGDIYRPRHGFVKPTKQ